MYGVVALVKQKMCKIIPIHYIHSLHKEGNVLRDCFINENYGYKLSSFKACHEIKCIFFDKVRYFRV